MKSMWPSNRSDPQYQDPEPQGVLGPRTPASARHQLLESQPPTAQSFRVTVFELSPKIAAARCRGSNRASVIARDTRTRPPFSPRFLGCHHQEPGSSAAFTAGHPRQSLRAPGT